MDKTGIAEMLRKLTAADGPSGGEDAVAAVVRSLAQEFALDLRADAGADAGADALGNVIARRAGTAEPSGRIMLAAHMDEIGLIVTKVDAGFLHVAAIGGVDPRSVLGQEVTVYPTGPGSEEYPGGLPGYIGSRPPHVLSADEREKMIPLRDLRVDLGQPPSFFAGGIVRVGDRVAIRGPFTELLNGRVATKSLDNRASVAAMLGALGYLADMRHTWDVYAVATVQEEIGLRGAITSAFGLAPDLAVAIDVTFGDTPGVNGGKTVAMDKGPAIGWGPNLHPGGVKRLRGAADALGVPYGTQPLPGHSGTDAWAVQVTREGIPTALLSIPVRYMHSAVETIVLADIDRTARLLAAFISRLDDAFLAGLAEEV
jgi:tetrahedral aminopeptidase